METGTLEVTACKSGAVDVHCRAIPAGGVHLVGHLADAVAEVVCQIFAPSHADEGSSREADRADAGEVVVAMMSTASGPPAPPRALAE